MKREIKVGVLIFLSLISLFIAIFLIKDLNLRKTGKKYIIRFNYISKILVRSPVKIYGGITIGNINEITYDKNKARIHITIYDSKINSMIKNRKLQFSVKQDGIFSNSYLLLEFDKAASKEIVFIKNKDNTFQIPIIEGFEKISDLDFLMQEGKLISSKVNKILEGHLSEILLQIEKYLKNENLNKIINNVFLTSINLEKLIRNGNILVSNFNRIILKINDQYLDKTLLNFNRTLKTIDSELKKNSYKLQILLDNTNRQITSLFKSNHGKINDFIISSNKVIKKFNKVFFSFSKILNNLNNVKMPLGSLLKDTSITKQFKIIIKNLNEITHKLKNNPLLNSIKNKKDGPF